jgi:hypothetical protein
MTKTKKTQTKKANEYGAVQGDVPILRLAALPAGAVQTQRRIVAYGEVTGHHHEITGQVECYECEVSLAGQLFKGLAVVVADVPARIEHNSGGEHAAIEMTPGVYFIPGPGQQQCEYDGAAERRVLD